MSFLLTEILTRKPIKTAVALAIDSGQLEMGSRLGISTRNGSLIERLRSCSPRRPEF